MSTEGTHGGIVTKGECGTAQWELNDDGTLLVHDGTIESGTLLKEDAGHDQSWSELKATVTSVRFSCVKGGKDLSFLMHGMENVTDVDLSGLHTGDTTNMHSMFAKCPSLRSVDLSSLDTHSVHNMRWMFLGCSSLESVDLSSFDTRNLINLDEMFAGCSLLREVDMSGFELPVEAHYLMRLFSGCSSLRHVSMPRWDRNDSLYVEGMFWNTMVSSITVHREGGSLFLNQLANDLSSCWTGWRGQVSRGVSKPLQCLETGKWHTIESAKRDCLLRDSSTYFLHPALLD